MKLVVQPIGEVDESVLGTAVECAAETFGFKVRVEAAAATPEYAWNVQRGQYGSFDVLLRLAAGAYPDDERVLGLTPHDLFIPALTFVFGQAQIDGKFALVSYARLRQEFYGIASDAELLRVRLRKEVIHELGHTLGLIHCPTPYCAMRLSTSILHVDVKEDRLCGACGTAARERVTRWRTERDEVSMEDPGR